MGVSAGPPEPVAAWLRSVDEASAGTSEDVPTASPNLGASPAPVTIPVVEWPVEHDVHWGVTLLVGSRALGGSDPGCDWLGCLESDLSICLAPADRAAGRADVTS